MIPSAVSTAVNSEKKLARPSVLGKRGSMYIEASMILPVSCLIMASAAGLIMTFYAGVEKQAAGHIKEAAEWDLHDEIEIIRKYDRHII